MSRQGEDFYPVDNFFDSEDFNSAKPSEQTREAILKDVLEIYFMLPELGIMEEITAGDLEIVDGFASLLLIPELSYEHTNLHLLEIYKVGSHERMFDNFIASLVFHPPEDQERIVTFDIYHDVIRKRFREYNFDPEEDGDDMEERFKEAIEYRTNLYELEKESEELAKELGLDFVSDKTALRVLRVIRQYKRHLEKYLKTPS